MREVQLNNRGDYMQVMTAVGREVQNLREVLDDVQIDSSHPPPHTHTNRLLPPPTHANRLLLHTHTSSYSLSAHLKEGQERSSRITRSMCGLTSLANMPIWVRENMWSLRSADLTGCCCWPALDGLNSRTVGVDM